MKDEMDKILLKKSKSKIQNPKSKIGLVLLAAGESRRLDFVPKQLLEFRGKTLIRHAAEIALNSNIVKVCVVLGANAEVISYKIKDLPLEITINENWQAGMSSSLKFGLKKLLEIEKNLSAVVVQLCDQPFITSENLNSLIEIYQKTNAPVVASEYGKTLGVPVLFSVLMFDEILVMQNTEGAKSLIYKHLDKTEKVEMPEAAFDIDTRQDYEKLLLH